MSDAEDGMLSESQGLTLSSLVAAAAAGDHHLLVVDGDDDDGDDDDGDDDDDEDDDDDRMVEPHFDDDGMAPHVPLSASSNGETSRMGLLDLDEFMDIVAIKCRMCPNFVCSSKIELSDHVRQVHQHHPQGHYPEGTAGGILRPQQLLRRPREEHQLVVSTLLDLAEAVEHVEEVRPGHRIMDAAAVSASQVQVSGKGAAGMKRSMANPEISPSQNLSGSSKDIVLCGVCSQPFSSVQRCNSHVLKEHGADFRGSGIEPRGPCEQPKLRRPRKPRSILPKASTGEDSSRNAVDVGEARPGKRLRKANGRFDDCVVTLVKPIKGNHPGWASSSAGGHRCPEQGCRISFDSEEVLEAHRACHLVRDDHQGRHDEDSNDEGLAKTAATAGQSATVPRFGCSEMACCSSGSSSGGRPTFDNWHGCALHLWKVHNKDVGLLACPQCPYRTVTAARLSTHLIIHSEDRQFACSVCRKRFKQLAQLKNHSVIHLDKRRQHHQDVEALDQEEVGPGRGRPTSSNSPWYVKKKCHLCDRYLADSKCLKKHIQAVHSKLRPYICQVCNHQSARKAMLVLHMRQHTGEKPFRCDTCEYKTGDHNSLRRHRMRHSGERPYKCSFCDFSSITCESYKNHVRAKHAEESSVKTSVFVCPQCPYKSVSIESFYDHLKNHAAADDLEDEELQAGTNSSGGLVPPNAAAPPVSEVGDLAPLAGTATAAPTASSASAAAIFGARMPKESPEDRAKSSSGEALRGSSGKMSVPNGRGRHRGQMNKTTASGPGFSTRRIDKVPPQVKPAADEEDSLHATTTDLGGTTIPAEPSLPLVPSQTVVPPQSS